MVFSNEYREQTGAKYLKIPQQNTYDTTHHDSCRSWYVFDDGDDDDDGDVVDDATIPASFYDEEHDIMSGMIKVGQV